MTAYVKKVLIWLWLSFDYHLIIVWLLFDYDLIIVWLLFDYCLIIVWLSFDNHLIIIWLLLDYCLIIVWLSFDYCLIIIWLSVDHHWFSSCYILTVSNPENGCSTQWAAVRTCFSLIIVPPQICWPRLAKARKEICHGNSSDTKDF